MGSQWIRYVAALGLIFGAACGDDADSNENDNNINNNNQSVALCGNGVVEVGEACDDGADNSDTAPDACRTDCRLAYCGDGVVDDGEACDDAGANSDRIANACRRNCQLPGCGDGVLDAGEACDDGNVEPVDGCDANCIVETNWSCDGEPSQCDCIDHRSGVGCATCRIYVDADSEADPPDGETWATAYPGVQEAVAAAVAAGAGCEIWIAEGTYSVMQASPQDTLLIPDKTGLYGGFVGDETDRSQADPWAHPTWISGQGPASTHVYHVVTAIGTTDATLDGLVVAFGEAQGLSLDGYGGGLLLTDGRLFVRNTLFHGNTAKQGGGILVYDSELTVQGCRFGGNQATDELNPGYTHGGGINGERCEVHIADTTFYKNEALGSGYGGGGAFEDCVLSFENVIFTRNSAAGRGGGLNITGPVGEVRMDNGIFVGNTADQGGALAVYGNLTLRGGLIVGNKSIGYGGGLYLIGDALLVNVTVAGNRVLGSDTLGAGVHVRGPTTPSYLAVGNSIFTDNQGNASTLRPIVLSGSSTADVTYTDIVGFSGPGNFTGSPGFVAYPPTALEALTYSGWRNDRDTGNLEVLVSGVSWTPGEKAGLLVTFDESTLGTVWAYVMDNTQDGLVLWGGYLTTQVSNAPITLYDVRLDSGSACIDRGNGTADVPTADLDGNPRVNDPNVTDQGVGTPTYVDLGGYERQP